MKEIEECIERFSRDMLALIKQNVMNETQALLEPKPKPIGIAEAIEEFAKKATGNTSVQRVYEKAPSADFESDLAY